MNTDKVTINLGGGREVTLSDVRVRYEGTETRGSGQPNIETYTCFVGSHELAGTWDQDGRHNTYVAECPAELAAELMPQWDRQQAARERADLAAIQTSERKFYGRVLTK